MGQNPKRKMPVLSFIIKYKKLITILVLFSLLLSIAASTLFGSFRPSNPQSIFQGEVGYYLDGSTSTIRFDKVPTDISIVPSNDALKIGYGKNGMNFTVTGEKDWVILKPGSSRLDTIAFVVDIQRAIWHVGENVRCGVNFTLGQGNYCSIEIELGYNSSKTTYSYMINGEQETVRSSLFGDMTNKTSIAISVRNGVVHVGINGVEDTCLIPTFHYFSPEVEGFCLGGGDLVPQGASLGLRKVQFGDNVDYHYLDGLHKTLLPDGKDFAFVFHMHADRAYPQQFYLMANLTKEYGILGSYDAWVSGNPYQYGMDSTSYREGLRSMDDAGWEIGTHAASILNLNRTQVIEAIAEIESEYGPVRTWSDHGLVLQDLYREGVNVSSDYYVADIVNNIGASWWNDRKSYNWQYDLNKGQMNYSGTDHFDIPAFKVSRGTGHDLIFEDGAQDNIADYLRGWCMERSVFVLHDYMPFFFYAENQTGSYSIMPSRDNIQYYPWSLLNPKSVFIDATWHPQPFFLEFLNWTKGYDVWSVPVREVYDRACIIEQLVIEETDEKITITNPTNHGLDGLTLFTKSKPIYRLDDGRGERVAGKGIGESWHFILDIGPCEKLVLNKTSTGGTAQGEESIICSGPLISGECLMARMDEGRAPRLGIRVPSR